MRRTNQPAVASFDTTRQASPTSVAAIAEFEAMLERRRKLDDAVANAPAQIAGAEQELAAMRSALATKETDIVFVDDAEVPALQKEIAKLATAVDAKDLELRRLRARVEALEVKAPEIDAQVDAAVCVIRQEASIAAAEVRDELAAEVRERAAALRLTYAKIRALQAISPSPKSIDFLSAAVVPDLDACGYFGLPANLLASESGETRAAAADIESRLKILSESLRTARMYQPYVPLAKRPGPYQYRGSNSGPKQGMGGSIGPGEPPIPYEPEASAFKAAESAAHRGG